MNRAHLALAESPPPPAGSGAGASADLAPFLEIARRWAGVEPLAILLGGSHASGHAVHATCDGRRWMLSDVDLYVVLDDPQHRLAAEARARSAWPGLAPRLLELGLAGPLEASFVAPADLARMAPRPATLELRRHGRVVHGDPGWIERIPAWTARDVPREEVFLLLENRAFELLVARRLGARSGVQRCMAHHALHKVTLDLATAMLLAEGELPDGDTARVSAARARWKEWTRGAPEPAWDAALAWREHGGDASEPLVAEELARAMRGWLAVWSRAVDPKSAAPDAFARARMAASRAPLRRRVGDAVHFRSRGGTAPGLLERLALAPRGTVQHRLNGTAAAWIAWNVAAADADMTARPRADQAMRRIADDLGVASGVPLEAIPDRLLECWDRWILEGQRGEGWA